MSQSLEDRYDAEVAEGFVKSAGRGTGLPKYLGVDIVDVGPGTMRVEMDVFEELQTGFGQHPRRRALGGLRSRARLCLLPLMKKGQWAATAEFKINLLAPVSKGTITADASVISMTRTWRS